MHLEKYTVKILKQKAKDRGLKGYSTLLKSDLIKLLRKKSSKKLCKKSKKPSITKAVAKRVGNKLGLKWDVVSVETFQQGMKVELEHGFECSRNELTNVTNNNLLNTGRIALAHLIEFPDYYARHKRMEAQAEKYWKGRNKPRVV